MWSGEAAEGITIAMDEMNKVIDDDWKDVCPYRYTAEGASAEVPLLLVNPSDGS